MYSCKYNDTIIYSTNTSYRYHTVSPNKYKTWIVKLNNVIIIIELFIILNLKIYVLRQSVGTRGSIREDNYEVNPRHFGSYKSGKLRGKGHKGQNSAVKSIQLSWAGQYKKGQYSTISSLLQSTVNH